MSLELIYTSVPRGLGPGASGFCTAAATGGMSRQVTAKLESLSGYQFHFNLSDPRAAENPANWAHTQVRIGAETLSVLSRIAFSGTDYSGRTNKIAHHFLLEHGEQLPNGPAWMLMEMAQHQAFVAGYSGEPRSLPKRDLRAVVPQDPRPPEPATTWQSMTGDAGWAGMLVKAFRENPKVPAFVIFAPGQQLLPLFEESLALLPPEERWQVGFATYYTALPAGCQYHWRGIIAGSSAAKEIQRFPGATVIDLTTALGRAPDNMFTQAARTGTVLPPVRAPERPKIQVVERAPQPVPLATKVVAGAEDLAFAMESGQHGPRVDPREMAPSPAQLRSLIRRARRARWVTPLVAAVILLAVSTLISTTLHFYNPLRSTPQAETTTAAATPAPPTQAAAPADDKTQAPPPKPAPEKAPAKPAAPSESRSAPAKGEAAENPGEELAALLDASKAVEKAVKEARSQMEVAAAAADEARNTLGQIPKEISAANLEEARQKLDDANVAVHKARRAADESKKQQQEAKKQGDLVREKADDLLARAKDDAKTKEAAQDAKKNAQHAAVDAAKSQGDAEKQVVDSENAFNQAKKRLDKTDRQIKDDLAKAPQVEARTRPRDNPWRDSGGQSQGQVKRQVQWPSSAEGNLRVFDLQSGRKFAFLELPRDVRAKVTDFEARQTSNDVVLNVAVQAGLERKKPFIASQIDAKRYMSCQIFEMPSMPRELTAIRDWLVIEVADLDARLVYQCTLGGREHRVLGKDVLVGYNPEGKVMPPQPVPFEYPWPEMLTAKVGTNDAVQLKMTDDKMFREYPLELKDDNKVKATLRIDINRSGNGYTIACSVQPLLNAVNAAVGEAKNIWAAERENLRAAENNLEECEKNSPNDRNKKNGLQNKIAEKRKAIQQIEEPVRKLLGAAQKALQQNGSVLICDAWGIPVVELRIRFDGEAGTIIKAALER
jgi:hypothetical protein